MPAGLAVPEEAHPAQLPEQDRVQALAARAVQEGRPVRVPARVQPAQDARVRVLQQERLLHAVARVPVPARGPAVEDPAVRVLRPGLLFGGPRLRAPPRDAAGRHRVPAVPERVLPARAGVPGGARDVLRQRALRPGHPQARLDPPRLRDPHAQAGRGDRTPAERHDGVIALHPALIVFLSNPNRYTPSPSCVSTQP